MLLKATKACTRCGTIKIYAEFGRLAAAADGRKSICRSCRTVSSSAYRANNRTALRERAQEYYEKNRSRLIAKATAYHSLNPDKAYAAVARYRTKNPETMRQANARRRALKLGASGSHTLAEWRIVLSQFNGSCAYCPSPATSRDHIVPLTRGGSDYISNIYPACAPCNSSKGNKLFLVEWFGRDT